MTLLYFVHREDFYPCKNLPIEDVDTRYVGPLCDVPLTSSTSWPNNISMVYTTYISYWICCNTMRMVLCAILNWFVRISIVKFNHTFLICQQMLDEAEQLAQKNWSIESEDKRKRIFISVDLSMKRYFSHFLFFCCFHSLKNDIYFRMYVKFSQISWIYNTAM